MNNKDRLYGETLRAAGADEVQDLLCMSLHGRISRREAEDFTEDQDLRQCIVSGLYDAVRGPSRPVPRSGKCGSPF